MNVNGKHYRTIWVKPGATEVVQAIDQRFLPYQFLIEDFQTVEQIECAIKEMHVRGAGLIGAAAGYGMYLSALRASCNSYDRFTAAILTDAEKLKASRPTAVNLVWAVDRQLDVIQSVNDVEEKIHAAFETAQAIADEDAAFCQSIGEHGVAIIEGLSKAKSGAIVNILTHCNAGWLAFVDYGTATAPIYAAYNRGIKVHVWVDETRPRNQGARLTAWELGQHGVPNTIIADNVGGHLMQHGLVDLVITGSDRTTYTGDVANKIGTYLKALAAQDNNIPFYVAFPSSSFDWKIQNGVKDIPIEQRDGDEVKYISGLYKGEIIPVLLTPENSVTENYSFDVTPARLVTGLITERGICSASAEGVFGLFPEQKR
ncbi:MAG: S-methyl-5-thioribose-1-phosphate isomerase [Anaerolineales bacterium]